MDDRGNEPSDQMTPEHVSPPATPSSPVGSPEPGDPWEMPPPVKIKTDWWFFAAGFFTPFVAFLGLGLVVNALTRANLPLPVITSVAPFALLGLAFFLFLYLWISGRSKGNVRMSSYGKGGLWAYVTIPLGMLLLFGSCLIGGAPL